jgi:hypothetical protein
MNLQERAGQGERFADRDAGDWWRYAAVES